MLLFLGASLVNCSIFASQNLMTKQKLNIICLLFALVYVAFSMRAAFVFVDYQVNYEFYSQVLCENKNKPELQCNGKCHMMKEMAETKDDEAKGQTSEFHRIRLVEIIHEVKIVSFIKSEKHAQFFTYSEAAESLGFTPPTPPPQLV